MDFLERPPCLRVKLKSGLVLFKALTSLRT
jgi:hypothetical protein